MEAVYLHEVKRLEDFERDVLRALESAAARQIFSICERSKSLAADIRRRCLDHRTALQSLWQHQGSKGDFSDPQTLHFKVEEIDLAQAFEKTIAVDLAIHEHAAVGLPFSPGHSQSLAPRSANMYCFSATSNAIFVYHLGSRTHAKTDSTYRLRQDAVWTLLGPLVVLYSGGIVGGDTVIDCATFNTLDIQWTPKAGMGVGRGQHCALLFSGTVYVFGGYHGHKVLSSCEKYSINADKWAPISNLLMPLCYVSGAEYQGRIYLGGRWSAKLQVYNVAEDVMSEAVLALPDHSGAPMVRIEDHLLILNNDVMHLFSPEQETLKSESKRVGNGGLFWSPVQWMVFGRALYILEYGALNVWRYDLGRGEMTLEAELEGNAD